MLADLYIEAFEFEKAIKSVKDGLRRIIDFGTVLIDYLSDDQELRINIPISLRVKMGISRLHMNDPNTAHLHFSILYGEDPVECAELFFDVAEAYILKGDYETALKILSFLTYSPMVYCDLI
jgi:general transcription factor 3C polypeptide 3 (transcription factor C subunit 4)